MIRKVFMLGLGEAEELRNRAFHRRLREAEIVREALRRHFGLPIEEATEEDGV